jgi:hypothetical protein
MAEEIFWDLPPRLSYIAGTNLWYRVSVFNPSRDRKEYMLMLRTFAGERQITEDAITVNGMVWFPIAGRDRVVLDGVSAVDTTNVLLVIQLIERESQQVVAEAATFLLEAH